MRFHWQNLNEGGRGLWSGRAWLSPWEWESARGKEALHVEWHLGGHAHNSSMRLTIGGEEMRGAFSLGIRGLFYIYIAWEGPQGSRAHVYGISLFGGGVCVWLGSDEWGNRPGNYVWDWRHTLIGRGKVEHTVIEERPVRLVLAEGEHQGTGKLIETIWRYPRWFPQTHRSVEIEFEEGVPIPGKGENSWDCGDDAIYAMSCPTKTISEGVQHFRNAVIARRNK